MAKILETKGLKIDLDNPNAEDLEILKKANPELYGIIFEGKERPKREIKKRVKVEAEVEVEKPKPKTKTKTKPKTKTESEK